MNTTNLLIRFNHHSHIKQPEYLKYNNAFVIQSPVNLELQPRSDAWIDLGFNIEQNLPELYNLWLKPSTIFGTLGLDIENKERWYEQLTKNKTIMLHLQNTSFYYKIKLKPNDIIQYAFLLGKGNNEEVITEYKII